MMKNDVLEGLADYARKERRERIKKMLTMTMIAGIGVIIVMLLYISTSQGTNNSVEEINQIMMELQNQAPE